MENQIDYLILNAIVQLKKASIYSIDDVVSTLQKISECSTDKLHLFQDKYYELLKWDVIDRPFAEGSTSRVVVVLTGKWDDNRLTEQARDFILQWRDKNPNEIQKPFA